MKSESWTINDSRGFIDLGDTCNARCYFCTNDHTTPTKSMSAIKKEIDDFISIGISQINYGVWEFTIHPDIFEILEYGKDRGIQQFIHTNWFKLANIEFVEKLKGLGIKNINISLHGASSSVADKISWIPWGYKKTIQGIKNCVQSQISVTVSFVITTDNLGETLWMYLLARKIWVSNLKYSFLNGGQKYQNDDIIPSLSQVYSELQRIINLHSRLKNSFLEIKLLNMPYCLAGSMGHNYIEKSMWSESFFTDNCKVCKDKETCTWFPEYHKTDKDARLFISEIQNLLWFKR